jgi:hypothetical protein
VRLDVISASLNVVHCHSSPSLVATTLHHRSVSLFAIFAITYCYHFSPSPSAPIHHCMLLLLFRLIHAWVSKKRKKDSRFVELLFANNIYVKQIEVKKIK